MYYFWLLPYSPSRDAYALDDADANLCHEHKKELHEVEGAVTPKKKHKRSWNIYMCNQNVSV